MPPTLAPPTDLATADGVAPARGDAPLGGRPLLLSLLPRTIEGPLTLAALGVGFFSLPWIAWTLTGQWVPEVLVFGVGAVVVGVVAKNR